MQLHTLTCTAALFISLLTGCSYAVPKQEALRTVPHVDLPRFMGGWYVIGTIPWIVERDNVGTMDVYQLRSDGKLNITYLFHKKSLTAKRQEMKAVATIVNKETQATWSVQFIWPFRSPFLVIDLASDYRYTVIGYPTRDLVWIMSRQPFLDPVDYEGILTRLTAQGYDITRIQKVPQATAVATHENP